MERTVETSGAMAKFYDSVASGYLDIYSTLFWSRSYRMSFYVIGNWIMSEKVCLGIYILAALLCNIALYLRPFGKLCIKIISVLFGPVLLLLTITCFACGDIMILTTFFLFFLYIMFGCPDHMAFGSRQI